MLVGVLTTPRLLLRRHVVSDAAELLVMAADPDTMRWNPVPGATDTDSAERWCRDAADWSDGTHVTFAIVDASGGRYAGTVSVHSIDLEHADAEIGYRVAPWARGRGFAAEAVTAATAWVFDNIDLVRIELIHAVPNPASCAVATKAGYLLEGRSRQSFVYGDGVRYDEHQHARIVTD